MEGLSELEDTMSQNISVERLMQTGLLHCSPDTLLCDAAARMASRSVSCIVIMEAGRPLGIWTERDALHVDFSDPAAVRIPIETVMSHPVRTIRIDTQVGEAAVRFQSEGHRHFLVTDRDDTPVGILTQTDVALNQGLEPYLRLRDVSSAMHQGPAVLNGDQPLSAAATQMRESGCDAVVVDSPALGLGIITERDMVRFIAHHPGNTPIGNLASRPLLIVHTNDALLHARDLLVDNHVRHLAVLNEDSQVTGLLGLKDLLTGTEHVYLQDLRKALEQRDHALQQSRQSLQLAERVIESSLEGIAITDAQARIEFINPAFTQLTGYRLEDVVGRTPQLLSSGRHDTAFYQRMWSTLLEHGYWRGEIWNRRKTGELYLELLTITAIVDEKGDTTNYAALFSDITHIRENEEQIHQLAYYDPLTRLPNRRLLEDRLSMAIHHAHRYRQRLAVMFLDLDHFKQVNDALGHAVGDELLSMVAKRLRQHLREDDTLARIGGDEFIVLLPNLHDIDEITHVAQRLIETASAPCVIGQHESRVGCSLGISLYPDDGETPEHLIHNADAAMYRAKQEGRNTYRLYTAEMNQQARQLLALETALRNTVETGNGLKVKYQPLVDHATRAVRSAEALLRWHHPEQGNIPPAQFIPLAERAGLIVPLGERLMHLVCQQLQAWRAKGHHPVPVAINLSAQQFWQDDLPGQVHQLLKSYDISPELISFELTESTLLDKHDQAIGILQRLRDLGCHIAIDDFGTGYSSLSYLHALPVNALKIDRSFIQALDGEDRGASAIMAAVAGLADALELGVVAEGVETETQWQALAPYQVDLVQGFLTGHPVDGDTFMERYLVSYQSQGT